MDVRTWHAKLRKPCAICVSMRSIIQHRCQGKILGFVLALIRNDFLKQEDPRRLQNAALEMSALSSLLTNCFEPTLQAQCMPSELPPLSGSQNLPSGVQQTWPRLLHENA